MGESRQEFPRGSYQPPSSKSNRIKTQTHHAGSRWESGHLRWADTGRYSLHTSVIRHHTARSQETELLMLTMAQNRIMMISEQHRYQGVSYKSDIIVISGLDPGDRQVLEQKYSGCDPPCLLDSSDGRFVLKGPSYNPLDVMNCLMTRRGYEVEGPPQQRTLPNIHNKDDKFAIIYHLSKEVSLARADTLPATTGPSLSPTGPKVALSSSLPVYSGSTDFIRQTSEEVLNAKKLRFSPQLGPPAVLKKIQHPFYSQTVEYRNSKM